MAKKFFPSGTDALLWAARVSQEVARVVAMTTIAGERWVGCSPVVARFYDEEDRQSLYLAYRTRCTAWADVITNAVRTVLKDCGVPIRHDYRRDYADGSHENTIESNEVKVEIVRDPWQQ